MVCTLTGSVVLNFRIIAPKSCLNRRFSVGKAVSGDKYGDLKGLSHLMHGRKNRERRDSITPEILRDRDRHSKRLSDIDIEAIEPCHRPREVLVREGLGQKRRRSNVYRRKVEVKLSAVDRATLGTGKLGLKVSSTGACGFATFLGVANADRALPVFKHLLPEIAFAGHSNCGKSSLVNAMVGLRPSKGPAAISDRAGWTTDISFYQVRPRRP